MAAWGYEFYLLVLKVSLTRSLRSLVCERYFQHSKIKFVPILIQTPVSTDNGHLSVLRVNPTLRTVFICALYTTEYLTTENLPQTANDLGKGSV